MLAFIIPSVTFIEYIEPIILNTKVFVTPAFEIIETLPEETPTDYIPFILWSIYGLGVFIFLLKFCINLYRIISRIRNNPRYKSANFINVLVKNLNIPHTFFNYIFFNKDKFENCEIPKEVILHEQTHAKQKHSIDVLILEISQIIFWFNPLIYFLKQDVKLNHEFLADQAVLHNGIQPSTYQQLLLAFSSSANEPQLANAINYSSIKKRFTVMKTKTSRTSVWLRTLLILPLIALTLYGFSEKVEVEKEAPLQEPHVESLDLYLNDDNELLKDNEVITFEMIENYFNENNNLEIAIKYNLNNKSISSQTLILKLREIGVKKITVCSSKEIVPNSAKKNNQKATQEQIDEYNRLAKHYNSQPKNKRIIKRKDLERLETLYGLMSDEQKSNALSFPECPPPPPPPTMDTIYTYKRLSKRIQTVSENRKANLIYLNDIYTKMSPNQKNKVKSPKDVLKQLEDSLNEKEWQKVKEYLNTQTQKSTVSLLEENQVKTGFININGLPNYYITINNVTKYYNRKGYEVSIKGRLISENQVNASDIIPGQYITKVYSDHKLVAEFKDNKPNNQQSVVDIPSPPKPISRLDHIINMAKKDATFFYEGKNISSDKAIELIKNNDDLNIFTKDITTNNPRVFLTTNTKAPNDN
ncbi:M56 family metallopeptidase [Psychroserpens ponticola]|uniref:M56 family metallopeptidase n=1 Tax=Psychroserpens ponticola TaxID=2932268 RepID=A0ABY7RW24_9FLAO|nr:M56 family metallopeptidase [Psychroserpens ponticola]WCO01331.1 M56 family metallopeptidase [Psychroserpens ponticola]